jgi:PAS domain S-box-containing protein
VTRWTGSVSDITSRKTSEAALRESEERFALAVAGSSDGLWDWDISSDEMFFAERTQNLYGLQPGPTSRPRREWRSMVRLHPEDMEDQRDMIAGYLEGTVPAYDGEWRVLHADGTYRWVRIRGVCVRDAQGNPTRLAGSVSDINAYKRAHAALQQSQRLEAVGTLAGGIAHDFNNILGAILGFGEMALKSARAGTRLRRDLECIMTAGERGRALVERILAFSRSGISTRNPVEVEGVVQEAVDLLSSGMPAGVRVHLQARADRATVLCDPTKLHQVVVNLATNAIQAMPDGGVLRIGVDRIAFDERGRSTTGDMEPGRYLVLTMADNGCGIHADVMPRIFDPFFTTKEPGAGTGLGLSLVHGIVTELGGAIDVASLEGMGSTFKVYLPCAGEAQADVAPIESPAVPRGAHQQVLVVDDEDSLVRLTTERLGELGYVCVGYTSSVDALVAFQAHPERFDAIVTDERMPALSGIALANAARGTRADIPVLLVSGYVGGDLVSRAHAAGVTSVLGKPLAANELAVALAQALASSQGPA